MTDGQATRGRSDPHERGNPRAFEGNRVLVTGAAGAFGSSTAEALRRRGASVAGLDLVPGATAPGPRTDDLSEQAIIACDVADDEQVNAAVAEAVERLGGHNALVNFAGIAVRPPRDVAGTRLGQLELWAARHVPGLVDAAIRSRVARQGRSGRYDGVPLARGLARRYGRASPYDEDGDPMQTSLRAGARAEGGHS